MREKGDFMKKLVCHLWIVSTIFVLSGCGTDSGVVKLEYRYFSRAEFGSGFENRDTVYAAS